MFQGKCGAFAATLLCSTVFGACANSDVPNSDVAIIGSVGTARISRDEVEEAAERAVPALAPSEALALLLDSTALWVEAHPDEELPSVLARLEYYAKVSSDLLRNAERLDAATKFREQCRLSRQRLGVVVNSEALEAMDRKRRPVF